MSQAMPMSCLYSILFCCDPVFEINLVVPKVSLLYECILKLQPLKKRWTFTVTELPNVPSGTGEFY